MFLNVPDESPESQLRMSFILPLQVLKYLCDLIVFHHTQNTLIQNRPGVTPIMRLSILAASAHHFVPATETSLTVLFKTFDDLIVESLIISHKYSFHFLIFLSCLSANIQ